MARATKKTTEAQILEKLGLSENEAELYSIMVRQPKVTVKELLKITRFPRTLIYYLLRNLMQAGLVDSIDDKRRTTYIVKDPEHLYDILTTKEKKFEEEKRSIEHLIPELKNQFRMSQSYLGMKHYSGVAGYRAALEQMIKAKPAMIYTYLALTKKNRPGVEIRNDIHKKRLKEGIPQQILMVENEVGKRWAKNYASKEMTQVRFLPKDFHPKLVKIHLYDGKMVYVTYEGREINVAVIQDQDFYNIQKSLFDFTWNQSKPAK